MSHFTSLPADGPHSVEAGINAVLSNVQESVLSKFDECQESVRKSPASSILAATAVGYCLHNLPVRAIIVAHVRLVSALVPPALFLFGAAKMYEFLQAEAAAAPRRQPTGG